MKYQFDNKQRHWGLAAFIVITAGMLVYYVIFHTASIIAGIRTFLGILAPVIYGIAIGFLLTPVLNFMENRIVYPVLEHYGIHFEKKGRGVTRLICVLIALILFLILIYALVMMVLPQFIRSTILVIQSMPRYAEVVSEWIESIIERGANLNPEMLDMLDQYYKQTQEFLNNNAIPQLTSMFNGITGSIIEVIIFLKNFLIGCIISIYVLVDKEKFVAKGKKLAYAAFSESRADFLIRSMRFTGATFSGFISGKLIDSAIMGVLCYIGLSLMNMPYALLISVIIGATNVIPFFGPFIGAIPSFLLILLVDPIKSIYFLIFILLLQQFDGNILGPMILGGSTGLSSFMVIVAILIGGGLFGVPGMILGVPTFAVLTTGIWNVVDRTLAKKQLPVEESEYMNISQIDPVTREPIPMPKPVRPKPEANGHRNPIFMKFWNALMKVVKPAWRYFLMGLEKIASWITKGVRAMNRFVKRYWPKLVENLKKFFQFIWKQIGVFFSFMKKKFTESRKPKN